MVIDADAVRLPKTVLESRSALASINRWRSVVYNEFLNDLRGFKRLDFFITFPYYVAFLAKFAGTTVERFTAAVCMALNNSDVQAGVPG